MSEEKPKLHIPSDWKSEGQARKEAAAGEGSGKKADDERPQLHVDADWKAQAQAEKERLAEAEAKREQAKDAGAAGPRGLPEANFMALVSTIGMQAVMGLGGFRDPQTGSPVIDLEGAKFSIDLLELLEEKTKGNLTEEERRELNQLLVELRHRFVQVNQLVAQAVASGAARPASPGAAGKPGQPPAGEGQRK